MTVAIFLFRVVMVHHTAVSQAGTTSLVATSNMLEFIGYILQVGLMIFFSLNLFEMSYVFGFVYFWQLCGLPAELITEGSRATKFSG